MKKLNRISKEIKEWGTVYLEEIIAMSFPQIKYMNCTAKTLHSNCKITRTE